MVYAETILVDFEVLFDEDCLLLEELGELNNDVVCGLVFSCIFSEVLIVCN